MSRLSAHSLSKPPWGLGASQRDGRRKVNRRRRKRGSLLVLGGLQRALVVHFSVTSALPTHSIPLGFSVHLQSVGGGSAEVGDWV